MDQSILTALRKIQEADESLKFYNTYHGIPVSFHGKIIRMIGARALISVLSLQIFSMLGNRGTHIKHKSLPSVIQAKISDFNLVEGTVELWNFEYTEETIGLRTEVRVFPEEPVLAICRLNEDTKIRTSVEDISLHGISLHMEKDTFEQLHLEEDQKVTIFLALDRKSEEKQRTLIQYEARIRNFVFHRDTSIPPREYYRIGFRTEPDKNTEKLLTHYVACREKELIAELKEKCGEESMI